MRTQCDFPAVCRSTKNAKETVMMACLFMSASRAPVETTPASVHYTGFFSSSLVRTLVQYDHVT